MLRLFVSLIAIGVLMETGAQGAPEGSEVPSVPVMTVCEALADPVGNAGKVFIVVGRWQGTGEGSWLSEDCGARVLVHGGSYSTMLWTAYSIAADFPPPPQLPAGFVWDRQLLKRALNEVKKTTRHGRHGRWFAVYGRLEFTKGPLGLGHLGESPAQLVWPVGGYLRLR